MKNVKMTFRSTRGLLNTCKTICSDESITNFHLLKWLSTLYIAPPFNANFHCLNDIILSVTLLRRVVVRQVLHETQHASHGTIIAKYASKTNQGMIIADSLICSTGIISNYIPVTSMLGFMKYLPYNSPLE